MKRIPDEALDEVLETAELSVKKNNLNISMPNITIYNSSIWLQLRKENNEIIIVRIYKHIL
jgi:hypothetical protein